MGLRVILQKRWSMSFVPPLDVGADAPAGNDEIERRYWSVFRPSALHDPIERIHARNAANHDSATSRSLRNSASTSPQIALANRRLEAVLTSLDRVLVAARAHESGPMTPATRDKLLGFMSHARAIFAELGLQTTTAAMDALTAIPQDALTFSVLTRKLEQVRATVTADAAAASPNTP
jgi:hypothetical protein